MLGVTIGLFSHAQTVFTYSFNGSGNIINVSPDDGTWKYKLTPTEGVTEVAVRLANMLQIGTGDAPCKEAVFTHDRMTEITNVTVVTKTTKAKVNSVSVSVGGTELGNTPITETGNDFQTCSFDAETALDGEVVITFSAPTAKKGTSSAIYLQSISITSGGEIIPQVNAPKFSHESGTYFEPFSLSLTADEGCTIHCTTDGTTATTTSPVYTEPIAIGLGTTTVSAVAVDANGNTSEAVTQTYTVAEAKQLIPATMEDVERGGRFCLASSGDLSTAWFAKNFTETQIDFTKNIQSYTLLQIVPTAEGYTLNMNGQAIGIYSDGNAELSASKHPYWEITELTPGQFAFRNTYGTTGGRVLLFAETNRFAQYYNENYAGKSDFSNYLFLFKEEGAEETGLTVSESRYTTFYSDMSVLVPEGLQAAAITGYESEPAAGGDPTFRLIYDWMYQPNSVIPAHTAVIMTGDPGSYPLVETSIPGKQPTKNCLYGTTETQCITEPAGNYYYFKLAYKSAEDHTLGFWFGDLNGGPFETQGGKAYLAIPQEDFPYRSNGFKIGSPTSAIQPDGQREAETMDVYAIDGQLVRRHATAGDALHGLRPGLYVIGGKKVIKR